MYIPGTLWWPLSWLDFRPSFGWLTFKDRGHLGSRYIYIHMYWDNHSRVKNKIITFVPKSQTFPLHGMAPLLYFERDHHIHTVDGRNLANHLGCRNQKTLQIMGETINLNWWVYRISEPSTVSGTNLTPLGGIQFHQRSIFQLNHPCDKFFQKW